MNKLNVDENAGKMYKRGVVHKYGGTSVVTARQDQEILRRIVEAYQRVPENGYTVLVVSGQGKFNHTIEGQKATDHMYDIVNGDNPHNRPEQAWRRVQDNYARKLIDHSLPETTISALTKRVQKILESGNINAQAKPLIIGFPELAEAEILYALAEKDYPGKFVLLNDNFGLVGFRKENSSYIDVPINHENSLNTIREMAWRDQPGLKGKIILLPGFLGNSMNTNMAGRDLITLERGSSDATATYWGAALDLDEIVIYSDRPGVLPVDPGIVPDLAPLSELSYREASAFAGLGAKIIQDIAIRPAEERRVKILVKDSRNPENGGTTIGVCGVSLERYGVKAIACDPDYAAVKVKRMRNSQRGIAAEVERQFADHGFSIDDQYDQSDSRLYIVRSNPQLHSLISDLGRQHLVSFEYPAARVALVGDGISIYQKLRLGKDANKHFTDVLEGCDIPIYGYSRVEGSVMISAVIPEEYHQLALGKLAEEFDFKKD